MKSDSLPHERMVRHTPRGKWIEARGLLLWLGFFFVEVGAGMYFSEWI